MAKKRKKVSRKRSEEAVDTDVQDAKALENDEPALAEGQIIDLITGEPVKLYWG